MPSNGESVSWTLSASSPKGIAVHRHHDPPSTFGASLDPLRALVHVKKNCVRFEQIQQAPFCLKKEHCVQLCPGVHSEHSLIDTRVGPIEHSQMDPTEGSREGGTRVKLCPGIHSLMDTRVGPIENSQMNPTDGSRSTKHTTGRALAHIPNFSQLVEGFVVWQIGNLGPWPNSTLYSPSFTKWRR